MFFYRSWEGCLPLSLKAITIIQVLKTGNAGPDELNNYRHISYLTFKSRVVERMVAIRHLDDADRMMPLQSAYRRHRTIRPKKR